LSRQLSPLRDNLQFGLIPVSPSLVLNYLHFGQNEFEFMNENSERARLANRGAARGYTPSVKSVCLAAAMRSS
jgi:hypothetical protein